MKKLLSILICIILALPAMAVSAESEGTYENLKYKVYDDYVEITGYNGSPSEIIIPSKIDGVAVTGIGKQAFYDCDSVTSLTIEDGLLTIDDMAFYGCTKLEGVVNIPDSVIYIGSNAFRDCSNITKIRLSDNLKSIGRLVFCGCSNLQSINIPNTLANIEEGTFCYCHSLSEVNIHENINNIGMWAFRECDSLKEINIPSSVTNIGMNAFLKCYSLTNINVDENNSYYSSIDGVLFNKNKTQLLVYPIGNLRTEYIVPDSVLTIGTSGETGTFAECVNLVSVSVPLGVTTISSYAFYGCSNLSNLQLPDSTIDIGSDIITETALYNNSDNWLNGVLYIGNHLIKADTDISGIYEVKDGTICIATNAFASCTDLESLIIPNTIIHINGSAFYNCVNLKSVDIKGGLISLYATAFERCRKLESVTIPKSIEKIYSGVIENNENLIVYYSGSKEEWNSIDNKYWKPTVYYNAIGTASPTISETNIKENVYNTGKCLEISLGNTEYDSKLITVFSNGSLYNSFNLTDISAGDTSKVIDIPENAKFAKVFIWSSLESMKPLGEVVTVIIEE